MDANHVMVKTLNSGRMATAYTVTNKHRKNPSQIIFNMRIYL